VGAVWLQVTEAQQQWWNFKADNFDSVLLFKVGKFYEVSPAAAVW
jgi:DNA mismatch repair protein MSH6